jgi:hypothetical protein
MGLRCGVTIGGAAQGLDEMALDLEGILCCCQTADQ